MAELTQTQKLQKSDTLRVNDHVIAPRIHDVFGRILEIDLFTASAKICNFDCPYCDLGRTSQRLNQIKDGESIRSVESIERAIEDALKTIHASGPAIDSIVISGNGEPTIHPDFAILMKTLCRLRESWQPGKRVILLTNGAALDNRKIADAANLLDERVVKIDCGNERSFKRVNAPLSRTNLAKVLTGIRKLKDVTVQSLFFDGPLANTTPSEIEDWIEVMALVRPKTVLIETLTHPPASPEVSPCSEDTLYSISARLERKTQIKGKVIFSAVP